MVTAGGAGTARVGIRDEKYGMAVAAPHSSPLVVDAVGVRVGIDLSGLTPPDRETVTRAWHDTRVNGTEADVTIAPVSSDREGQTLSDLSSAVTQAAIQARRGELWMLHAAGLAADDGGVTVLVGPSGAGKTTATRLLARTWGYVSDETVGIAADGRVHAYRKPLSVITEGQGYKVQHAPRDLGLLPLPDAPLRVRRVILLDRSDTRERARLTPVPASEALVLLAPHSSALASMPRPLRTVMDVLSRTGGVMRAEYAEAEELVGLLKEVAHSDADIGIAATQAPPDTATIDPAPLAETASPPSIAGQRYHRSAVVDALSLPDDRLAVLTAEADGRGVLRVLAGAAPLLWDAANGATRDDLLRAVTVGEADDEAERCVDGILAQLVETGLLTVGV